MDSQEIDNKLAEIEKNHPWFNGSNKPVTKEKSEPSPIPTFSPEIEKKIEEVARVHPWFRR
ncbi:hypothetical protein [Sphaerospermopsis sp. FACHB-1194]|uniref:hypothetical protein n=1 Tax=Sphaerospermopsis sp. FACHB-1194 TaxID=2692862 RepID=UPI0016802346|nr:hypothetical protein [Sphaerospermopsis sp. FACHB-1194]MBD2146535.1 hypothetical protein [Sphaerospermopsis sp. FACHB-1194]